MVKKKEEEKTRVETYLENLKKVTEEFLSYPEEKKVDILNTLSNEVKDNTVTLNIGTQEVSELTRILAGQNATLINLQKQLLQLKFKKKDTKDKGLH